MTGRQGDCFEVLVGPGGVQTRRYVAGRHPAIPKAPGPGERIGYQVMSKGALRRLRFTCANLPLDMLGDRWLWVTLTSPLDWRKWMGDDATTKACLTRLRLRLWRRYGVMVGIWVQEFQERGAPHFHMLLRCPDSVSEEEYAGLVDRQNVLREIGARPVLYRGRVFRPSIGVQKIGPFAGRSFGGEFAETLRKQWSEVVTGGTDGTHFARGVDVEVPLPGRDHEIDRRKLLCYLATEMGKGQQKQAPSGFGTVRRWWDLWGRQEGFAPQYMRYVIPAEAGELLTLQIRGWVENRMAERRGRIGLAADRPRPWRPGTGATAIGLTEDEFKVMVERVNDEVGSLDWTGGASGESMRIPRVVVTGMGDNRTDRLTAGEVEAG